MHIKNVIHFQVGAQCIHLAAKSGSLATLQLIISYGADLNARTDPQLFQTPLHFAASNPTPETCQMLLTNGADATARDAVRYLKFFFFEIKISSFLCTCCCLIALICSTYINPLQAGCTAVHVAAKCGRVGTVRFLADTVGAHILLVNDFKGISPDLYCTSRYMSNQIRQLIEEHTNTAPAAVEVKESAADSGWGFSFSNPRRSKFLR